MSQARNEFIEKTDKIADEYVDKPHFLHANGAKNTLLSTRDEALEIGRLEGRQELLAEFALSGLVSLNDLGEINDEYQGTFSFNEDQQLSLEAQNQDNVIPIRKTKPPRKLVFDDSAVSQSLDVAREEV